MKIGLMRSVLAVGMMAVAAFMSGCASLPPADMRITLADGLEHRLYLSNVRCKRASGGNLVLNVDAMNTLRHELWIEYRVSWSDEVGIEMESLASTWQKIAIAPRDIKSLSGVAPSPEAADWRLYIREMK